MRDPQPNVRKSNRRRGMSSVRWLMVTLIAGVAAGAAWMTRSRRREHRRLEVGSVSDEWIASHRADSP
jgi:hypothetical protein